MFVLVCRFVLSCGDGVQAVIACYLPDACFFYPSLFLLRWHLLGRGSRLLIGLVLCKVRSWHPMLRFRSRATFQSRMSGYIDSFPFLHIFQAGFVHACDAT